MQSLQGRSQPVDTRWFYRELRSLASFEEAANAQNHTQIPPDWWIVICDVVGSTVAIEAGLYKNVNTIGAATIVSVLNVDRSILVPFIFGGDGASLAVPPCMVAGARGALLGAQELARNGFNLDLRIGLVPVSVLLKNGDRVNVGKYQLGKGVFQASFSGFGWDLAEALLKDPKTRSLYEITPSPDIKPEADFTGFECRWKPVEAQNDHKLAILVRSLSRDSQDHLTVYNQLLQKISEIYGNSLNLHPIRANKIRLTLNPRALLGELKVRTQGATLQARMQFAVKLFLSVVVGRVVMALGLRLFGIEWGSYRDELVQNSDFRKFDGTLKMVVDGTIEQRDRLEKYLKQEHAARRLVYGLHSSRAAIVTCIVFSHAEQHSHFVDGSDGGYTMAAKMFKAQLKAFRDSTSETAA